MKDRLKKYKGRHVNVAKKVHWDICKKKRLEHSKKWYEHILEGAVENEEIKVLWDINIYFDNLIKARRPDVVVIDKKEQKGIIIGIYLFIYLFNNIYTSSKYQLQKLFFLQSPV